MLSACSRCVSVDGLEQVECSRLPGAVHRGLGQRASHLRQRPGHIVVGRLEVVQRLFHRLEQDHFVFVERTGLAPVKAHLFVERQKLSTAEGFDLLQRWLNQLIMGLSGVVTCQCRGHCAQLGVDFLEVFIQEFHARQGFLGLLHGQGVAPTRVRRRRRGREPRKARLQEVLEGTTPAPEPS